MESMTYLYLCTKAEFLLISRGAVLSSMPAGPSFGTGRGIGEIPHATTCGSL